MSSPSVVVTFSPSPEMRAALRETLEPVADVTYLPELDSSDRAAALASARAVITWFMAAELDEPAELGEPAELDALRSVELIQLLSAGADRVPFDRLPPDLPVASNAGAYSDPMAEHVLAMALALAKRLPQNHAAMRRGEFDQQTLSQAIRGSVVGVLGFGGIGQASAQLFNALGAQIHAINRSGRTDAPVDAIGTLDDDLDAVLAVAAILVISLPLTRATEGLIGARELSLMKPDAILVNVARAAIVDEDALYEHLHVNPSFCAGIDAWWEEPRGDEPFRPRQPFLELPNVIGSPHNSAITAGSLAEAARCAAANVARHLRGEPVEHLVDRADYLESV
jgi:phosphoglycerate dehydrogenase-like enzyme